MMKSRSGAMSFPLYLLVVFMSFLVVRDSSASPGNALVLLTPLPDSPAVASSRSSQKQSEPYITRSGEVYLDAAAVFKRQLAPSADTVSVKAVFKGIRFALSFFPDRNISVIVDAESRPSNGVISLGGHLAGKEISTFSMTVTEKNYLITYQDPDNGVKYRIVGDVGTGIGQVVEIDLNKIPPVYDSEPLVPPE